MLFFLIFSTFGITKYLYIGSENCNADGNEAYLDSPIEDGNNIICSSSIPNVLSNELLGFITSEADLILIFLQTGFYLGLENLNSFKKVTFQKKYTNDANIILSISSVLDPLSFSINKLYVSNGINIEINAYSYSQQQATHLINEITLDGTETKVKPVQIQIGELVVVVDKDYILDDSIKEINTPKITFKGPYKIIDDTQILNEKLITLDETNLEYTGKEGYNFLILIYHGKETIKRKQEDQPQLIIGITYLRLFDDITINQFIDASISNILINGMKNENVLMTIDTPTSIYLPISLISNVTIKSNGKIDVDEEMLIYADDLDISIFSGNTKNGDKLKIIYYIDSEKICYAFVFSNDFELNNQFIDYPLKGFLSNKLNQIPIRNKHLKGITILGDLNIILEDSNCKVDAILLGGTGKLLDNNNNEQNPEYFKITRKDLLYEFEPMKSDVTNYNDFSFLSFKNQLFLKHYDGEEITQYKFLYDIRTDSIIIDEKINVQFDCNLILNNKLTIPESSSIANSPESGVLALTTSNNLILMHLSSEYKKKFNRIQFSSEYDLINNTNIKIDDQFGSTNSELNTFSFGFGFDDQMSLCLNILSIEAIKGLNIEFEAKSVKVNENSIVIDKKTLIPNPQFSAADEFQMGVLEENGDVYIKRGNTNYIDVDVNKYSKLYLDGNVRFIKSDNKNDFDISGLLYIKGKIHQGNDVNINTYNLILNVDGEQNLFPSFSIQNSLFTNMISTFSLIEKIKSPKIVFTGIDSNQNIIIKGKNVQLKKDEILYALNTEQYSKIILYLPNVEQHSTLLDENGNIVNLKVESSTENPTVLDFNVININENGNQNMQALLKFVIDDSIKTNKPKFDGEFGYAFDNGLEGKVVYKDGNDGNEVEQSPEYFPIIKVEMEPFILKAESNPTDFISDSITNAMTDSISSSMTDSTADSMSNFITDDFSDNVEVSDNSNIVTSSDENNKNDDKDDKNGLSKGAKIGIGIGSAAAAVLAGFGIGVPIKKYIDNKDDDSVSEGFEVQ